MVSPLTCNATSLCSCARSEEHTSELQSHLNLVCRLLLEKKKIKSRHEDTVNSLTGLEPAPHRAPTLNSVDRHVVEPDGVHGVRNSSSTKSATRTCELADA